MHSLIAIDPTGDRATWTTIRRPLTKPRATLRSEGTDVTDVTDRSLTAAL